MAKITAGDIDFTTTDPVVFFTGEAVPDDVPQRDLNAADLAYIHRVRALIASEGAPVKAARPMDVAAVANDLLEHAGFSARAVPEPKAKVRKKGAAKASALASAPVEQPTEAPASPAEEK